MPRYLIDTWFLVALSLRTDADHQAAARLWRTINRATLVTHDGVLAEYLTFFAEFGPHMRRKAVQTVRALTSYRTDVVPQNRALFLDAVALYESRPDKEYSLVDCMSMVVMKERGITHVLTNDHHFRQEGFTVVSE